MIWAVIALIVVLIIDIVMTRRAFRKWAYVTKEQGYHLMAVNKVLYLHEVRLRDGRRTNTEKLQQ